MGEQAPRYPVLKAAIECGRLAEAGVPDPRKRKLRDPWQAVDDLSKQVGWERRILTNPSVQAAIGESIPAIEAFEETL